MYGFTPLHESTWQGRSLEPLWELLCYNRDCVSVQNNDEMAALQYVLALETRQAIDPLEMFRRDGLVLYCIKH